MRKNNGALQQYCWQVRKWLPCGGKMATQILQDLQLHIDDYLEDNPDADLKQLIEHFGQPRDTACAYVEMQNTQELLSVLRLRRGLVALSAALSLAALALWGAGK